MYLRASISILICSIGILTAQAQLTKEDSIRLKRMLEGKEEVIINQEAVKSIEFNFVPREELFRQKLMIVDEKPWMRFIKKLPSEFIRKEIPESEITFKPNLTLPPNVSTSLIGFDADKLLFENLTKRGRAIKHNRKHAKAWKTYNDSIANKEDSLEWEENKKRIPKDTLIVNKDSLHYFINTK